MTYLKATCLLLAVLFVMSAGCNEAQKKDILNAVSPYVVLAGSQQWCDQNPAECYGNDTIVINGSSVTVETITTEPTPTPTPEFTVEPLSTYPPVDPYAPGQRVEGQWFRWNWSNASGHVSADRGIVVYGHSFHDAFTYWNDAWGNYGRIVPPSGMRFLAVYVHMEEFNEKDPGTWGYGPGYFYLQYNDAIHTNYTGYNPVFRLVELEERKSDYYNIAFIKPYGAHRIYGGMQDAYNGGYHVEYFMDLRYGKGNAWDGYILYLVPTNIRDKDIRILGNFANTGVNWVFDATKYRVLYAGQPNYEYQTTKKPEGENL